MSEVAKEVADSRVLGLVEALVKQSVTRAFSTWEKRMIG
jgi:hypothetical protein